MNPMAVPPYVFLLGWIAGALGGLVLGLALRWQRDGER